MKLFVGSVATETNTFSPMPTGLADFDVIRGDEFTAEKAGEMGEFEALRQCALNGGHEFVFSLAAFAQPAGITVRSAYETLRDECLNALQAAMPVDIVFLPLHGAMVADGYDDCEGDLIYRVRQMVGPDVVIAVELDLHCHLTQFMLDHADLIVIYLIQNAPDLSAEAAVAVAGNTSMVKLRTAQPKFVRRTYQALGL